jgi:hypothetical protein
MAENLYAKPNIRETTQRSYKGIIEMHIIPYIGSIMLTKLTTRDIQKMYNDLRTNGNMRAETKEKSPGLSSSYVRSVHMVLHNCLDRAVKERLLPSNPTENQSLRKRK